tara:strand:- start:7935 stop:8159 length:225 start_codon:yes stop_codon:yes gene_type:complete
MKENTIFDEDKKLRILAKNTIDKVTKLRKEKGWVVISSKDKNTIKQVHPDKLQGYLEEGWKLKNKQDEKSKIYG